MIVYYRGNRSEARQVLTEFVQSLYGQSEKHVAEARAVYQAIGLAALSDIKDDFVRKSKGEIGEDGNIWQPLSPKYLAYGRRFGRGEQARLKKAAGLTRSHSRRGLLSPAQDRLWRGVFASNVARFFPELPLVEAKRRAGQMAWAYVKSLGAKTKLEVFGNRPAQMLRDTGVLLNSLSPGVLDAGSTGDPAGAYSPPDDQIFELGVAGVIVGTNVPYASVHQNGSEKRGIPARPFLPTDGDTPVIWRRRWVAAGRRAVTAALLRIFGGAG